MKDGINKAFRGYVPANDKENERAAWSLIKEEVEKLIAAYPTTLKEDQELL